MNLPHFLAKRFIFTPSKKKKSFTIIKIASGGITLGVFVIFLAISITLGFQKEIHKKLMGFSRHISLTSYSTDNLQSPPISLKKGLSILDGMKNIKSKSPYTSIGSIIVSENESEAVLLKGVTSSYDWSFLKDNLVEGRCPILYTDRKSNEILISTTLAQKLRLKLGDKLKAHFIKNPPRTRLFNIVGIYNTNISDLDRHYALIDARHIQKIQGWNDDMYSGIEITLNNVDKLDESTQELRDRTLNAMNKEDDLMKVVNTKEYYSQIFDWLKVMEVNVKIILFLIIMISSFNMISALLVIIIEKTQHIGILKSMGMRNRQIRAIFLYKALFIIGRGLFWGNISAFCFALLQQKFQWITLNPEFYYLKHVPISISPLIWIFVNLMVVIVTLLIMIIPTTYIAKISPSKAIKIS